MNQVLQQFGDLRVVDLVAKTAKVSIKDTVRVLLSLKATGMVFGVQLNDLIKVGVGEVIFDTNRPTSQNVAACEQAYDFLCKEDTARREDRGEPLSPLAVVMDAITLHK